MGTFSCCFFSCMMVIFFGAPPPSPLGVSDVLRLDIVGADGAGTKINNFGITIYYAADGGSP